MMKIATWNVNSLRVRLPQVLDWLVCHQPDVLAIQETKLPDDLFPLEAILQSGYQAVYSGQPTYNGVALFSKKSMTEVVTGIPTLEDPQRRVLGATLGDIRFLNLYVPNGESVESVKYDYKLNWLKHLQDFLKKEIKHYPQMILLGDFNIAPENEDVYDPKAWEGRVLFSQKERAALQAILKIGFVDSFRLFSQPEKSYTWWDYRLNAFKRKMGLRIDHILLSEALVSHCKKAYIDTAPRSHERPSDHAVMVVELSF